MPIQRYIRWFSKTDESLQGESPFSCPLETLQSVFGVESGDPMVDCWAVTPYHKKEVEKVTGISISLNEFDYFIEVDEI